jgi:hypothetical protein
MLCSQKTHHSVSSRGAGGLDAPVGVAQLPAADGGVGVGVHKLYQPLQCAWLGADVGVQNQRVAPARDLQPLIARCTEAAIVGVRNQAHLEEPLGDHRRAAIGGSVVHDDDLYGKPVPLLAQD